MITNENRSESLPEKEFPLLSRLALSGDELSALAGQGFIASENRGRKKVFRLRYRVRGQQHVRYVSPHDVAALEAELATLQSRVRARRRLAHLSALARLALRQRKLRLGPLLQVRGFHFHGHQIRRCRS